MNKYSQFSKSKFRRDSRSIVRCKEKRRYCTEEYALEVAEKQSREFGHPMHAYYCGMCLGWHTTKNPNMVEYYEDK